MKELNKEKQWIRKKIRKSEEKWINEEQIMK